MVTCDLATSPQGDRAWITIALSLSKKLRPWKVTTPCPNTQGSQCLLVVGIRLELGLLSLSPLHQLDKPKFQEVPRTLPGERSQRREGQSSKQVEGKVRVAVS